MPSKKPFDEAAKQQMIANIKRRAADLPIHDTGVRLCPSCMRSLPHDHFDALPDAGLCRYCTAHENADTLKRQFEENAADVMDRLLEQTGRSVVSTPKLETMLGELMEYHGSMKAFVKLWMDHLMRVIKQKPNSIGVLQHFTAIAKLIGEVDSHANDLEITRMTRDQIRAEQKRMMLDMMLEASQDERKRDLLFTVLKANGIEVDGPLDAQHPAMESQ